MAEQEQNRSEKATPFKLEQARKRGTVAKSQDMVTAGMLLVVVVYLYWLGWSTAKGELKLAQTALAQAGRLDFSPAATLGFVGRLLTESVHALVPFLLALVIGAIVSNLAQTGPVFSLKPLSPDFSRINPAEGFKRFLSMRILYTAVKSLFKLLLLGCVFTMALHSMLSPLLGLLGADPVGYAPKLLDLAASLAGKLALVIFALALIDVVYVHREFAKKMLMSRRELREEVKHREGDPRVRARLRELRNELLKRSRALKKLPSANVLVTNPTHIAVAISYKHGEMHALRRFAGHNTDIVLVLLVVGVLLVLFSPIPADLLDFLLLANFSFALLILLLTFYMGKPVEFSTFPSLLLIATLFRLSLNIAATRLILSNADAGKVIAAVGSYVVQGNYVIGLIIFLILVVVQYVVVTSGAQRVSEVAARFTLDSMPGQQMSIDADLNMGFIDQDEAKRRRKNLEKEAAFYGAMDGASKFVKGDAIAGIIILLINIVGGLIIGMTQMNMAWNEALSTFTLLTIGDGIVTQVPALIISVATGIIVTRSGSDEHLSLEVLRQITSFPKTLGLVAGMLAVLMFLPGIPALPGIILIAAAALCAFIVFRKQKLEAAVSTAAEASREEKLGDQDAYGALKVEAIEVGLGLNLVSMVGGEQSLFMERVSSFRKQYALDSGLVLPRIRL